MARKMKDSGVKWIGQIPDGWSVTKIKNYCSEIYAGGTPSTGIEEYWDGDIPWIPSGCCHNCIVDRAPKMITQLGLDNSSTKKIPANTALVAMTGATCGNTGFLTIEACANQSVTAYVSKKNVSCSKYIYYLLQSAKKELLTFQTGGAQGGINVENCKNICVPFVPVQEQERIVSFLDEKISEIDVIISNTKESVEEYKKYKQAIITESILGSKQKGQELKDVSNIFIKRIPKNWMLCKLKYLSEEIGDGLHSTPEYDDKGDVYFINGNNIGGEYLEIKPSTNKLNDLEYGRYKKPLLNDQTIMIALNGATYGKLSFYNFEKVLLGKSAGYITLKTGVNKRYMKYYLQSSLAKNFMSLSLNGTTIQNLSLGTLNEMVVIAPSTMEQQNIVDYLDAKCADIDTLIEKKEAFLEIMEAYKKSLIYEYVTGKKEVL